jgi:spermidine/putrescine-binding protein
MLTRRTVLLSALGLAAASPALAQQRTLTINSFGGAYEQTHRKAVIEPFEKLHNVKVNVVTVYSADALAQLRAQKAAPQFDVLHFSGGQEAVAAREGLLEKVTPADLAESGANLYPFATAGLARGEGPVMQVAAMGMIYHADKVKPAPTSWKDLLDPKFKGKTALVDYAPVGVMDVAMALEARGDFKYADKGNMTKDEIDKTIKIMIDMKKGGHFRSFWSTFDQSVNLMASGEVVLQSMWSPAVTAVRSRDIACYYVPLQEGYRAWASCIAPMAHLEGIKLDAAYEYLNWYQSGWQGAFIAKQGYYTSVPETAKQLMTANEWNYWYEGKPAEKEILDPYGNHMEDAGHVRDGGTFWERMGHVACWNTLMDENRYMIRKWNEFVAS